MFDAGPGFDVDYSCSWGVGRGGGGGGIWGERGGVGGGGGGKVETEELKDEGCEGDDDGCAGAVEED